MRPEAVEDLQQTGGAFGDQIRQDHQAVHDEQTGQ